MIDLKTLNNLFIFNALTYLLFSLIGFVGLVIASFSFRYLKGDTRIKRFYTYFILCIVSMLVWSSSNHLFVFLLSWTFANFSLIQLMKHKATWQVAKASSYLTLRTFSWAFICLSLSSFILYKMSGSFYLSQIVNELLPSRGLALTLLLILIASCIQSGLWPFHKWLLSSLNSPTPVSAMMHAGLINGGGILLTRFAPLYFKMPVFFSAILLVGLLSACVGTLWKLMQSDIKRLLACSTLGQMGFMFVQCGLGLFPAALAHLFFHGLFKAYLFLNSGMAAKKPKLESSSYNSPLSFFLGLLCALIAAIFFAQVSKKTLYPMDTHLILIFVAFIAAFQIASVFLKHLSFKSLFVLPFIMMAMGSIYGFNVLFIEHYLEPLNLAKAQPLNLLHYVSLGVMTIFWIFFELREKLKTQKFLARIYVLALNASLPHSTTITSNKNNYTYQ